MFTFEFGFELNRNFKSVYLIMVMANRIKFEINYYFNCLIYWHLLSQIDVFMNFDVSISWKLWVLAKRKILAEQIILNLTMFMHLLFLDSQQACC